MKSIHLISKSLLDLHLSFSNDMLSAKIYDTGTAGISITKINMNIKNKKGP